MILIALGANLPSPAGPPLTTCRAALTALGERGVSVVAVAPWYETAPVPASDQPNFINGVAELTTDLSPAALLVVLHGVERGFGRVRGAPNAARTLDLDLLDYHGLIQAGPPALPHPRLSTRAFVLAPLADLAPGWRHPIIGATALELLPKTVDNQIVKKIGPVHPPGFHG
ncbi:MAG: 2-amino-4-hydroxy-6-hydroxymethyldihydropteridine diphosphokinase [Rhodospirillaceae bacterium]|nr:2-amino-4-hydroxy-6-hydroxymethyldihydropteridine diphosphokinase [Rhodospirillaceae bacterium]